MRAAAMLAARILVSAIFVQGALGKILGWEGQAAYMRSHGITHLVTPLLGAALVIEAGGVLCVLSGLWAKAAAAVMCAYLVVISLLLHDFWAAPAARAGMMQTEFLKNMAIAGGLLVLAVYGPGSWALETTRSGPGPERRG
jgi:putative oxidoreductase